jgi:hypothetical protein
MDIWFIDLQRSIYKVQRFCKSAMDGGSLLIGKLLKSSNLRIFILLKNPLGISFNSYFPATTRFEDSGIPAH